MAVTYEPIATTTLGSDTASVTFSSISGSYTDLVLVCNAGASATASALKLRFNSDTGNKYSVTTLYGDGTTAASARQTASTNAGDGAYVAYYVCPVSAIEFNSISHIMNYANTTTNKTIVSRANRASASNFPGTETTVCMYASTSAITSIEIRGGGNLKSGSTFTLYGIKAA